MAASTTGTTTSLVSGPCQRTIETDTETLPGSRTLASSSHENGAAPPVDVPAADEGNGSWLGGAFFLCA